MKRVSPTRCQRETQRPSLGNHVLDGCLVEFFLEANSYALKLFWHMQLEVSTLTNFTTGPFQGSAKSCLGFEKGPFFVHIHMAVIHNIYFRASGSVRRHCPLPFLLPPLSLVSLVCSVVLSPSPPPQASLSPISLSRMYVCMYICMYACLYVMEVSK